MNAENKWRKNFSKLFWPSICIFLLGCTGQVLEIEDAANFKAEILSSQSENKILRIQGASMRSSFVAKELKIKENDDALDVLVYLKLPGENANGDFKYDINISPKINKVFFGKSKVLIWRRD